MTVGEDLTHFHGVACESTLSPPQPGIRDLISLPCYTQGTLRVVLPESLV